MVGWTEEGPALVAGKFVNFWSQSEYTMQKHFELFMKRF
jgi:hypothetical protein